MPTFTSPTPRDEPPGGDGVSDRAVQENPLLAFGSEADQDGVTAWKPADATASSPRLAEVSWRADQPQQRMPSGLQAGASSSGLQRFTIPGLLAGCALVAAAIYAEPVYSRLDLPDVKPPVPTVALIAPISAPPLSGMVPAGHAAAQVPSSSNAVVDRGRTLPDRSRTQIDRSPAPIARPAQPAVSPVAGRAAAVAGMGSLSINALPWADVWIDGQSAGQTPVANIQVPLGTHEVLFRHPQLGERRQTVVVNGVAPTRISLDLRK